MRKEPENLVGMRFGKWEILAEVGYDNNSHIIVECKCDCGTIKNVMYYRLKRGTSKSCGHCKSKEDLTGRQFGEWTVKEYKGYNDNHDKTWLCVCSCGTERIIIGSKLLYGRTFSCGCVALKNAHDAARTHGMSRTRLYTEFHHMHGRCREDAHCHRLYYDIGIRVCDEWKHFEPFMEWALQNGYEDDLTLDRINTYGNYEPSNCRWATVKQQANNTKANRCITIENESHTLAEWCEIFGVNYWTVHSRLHRGWDVIEAFITPPIKTRRTA